MNGFKIQMNGWAIGMFFCGWNVGGRLYDEAFTVGDRKDVEPSWSGKNKGTTFDAAGAEKIQKKLADLGFKTTIVNS